MFKELSAKPSFQANKKFKNKVDIKNKRCKMRTSLEQGESLGSKASSELRRSRNVL
ncbi:hypothetical protein KUC3_32600 [Alteromonas sp. KC3]|nr:hypothetical protein KUC3_32600 [Alteromonas sp. KC3]BCO24369.1 hypothetical protein KUC14_32380 [Alteromonas sp. KC14]